MEITILNLPDEILIKILEYIKNVRNKIALLRVCRRFYFAGLRALRVQEYELDHDAHDKNNSYRLIAEPLPFERLLSMAPRLTNLFEYAVLLKVKKPRIDQELVPFKLTYIRKMQLRLDRTDNPIRWLKSLRDYPIKLKMFLGNCPNIEQLRIDIDPSYRLSYWNSDWSNQFRIPLSPKLVNFEFIIDTKGKYVLPKNLYSNFFGIIDGQAPNLEKFQMKIYDISEIKEHSADGLFQEFTFKLVKTLSNHCPKMKEINLIFDVLGAYSGPRIESHHDYIFLEQFYNFLQMTDTLEKLPHLETLVIDGVETATEYVWLKSSTGRPVSSYSTHTSRRIVYI